MPTPKPIAKTTEQGYIRLDLAQTPGCLARFQAQARRALWAAAWMGLGFVGGMICRGRFYW